MRRTWLLGLALLSLGVAGCGDDGGGGGGGGSFSSRCNNWCEKRNNDADCTDFNCPASCTSIVLTAQNKGCDTQLGTLLTCLEGISADAYCAAGQPEPCSAENTALVVCENSTGDAGP